MARPPTAGYILRFIVSLPAATRACTTRRFCGSMKRHGRHDTYLQPLSQTRLVIFYRPLKMRDCTYACWKRPLTLSQFQG
ncbi:hypothetical protein C8J56DRAFT_103787 [Mycena floridula]|nr:hypothetical protein C8J56DRAFT_103787 [Mycena floridula]